MPDFLYLVVGKEGERTSGEIEAPTREKVVALLQKKGFTVLQVDQVKPKHWIWHVLQPVKPQLLAMWIRQISVMLRAGIPLSRGLTSVQPQTGPLRFKKGMARVLQDVNNGFSLSQAMLRAPEFFSRFMIGSTRVGEASGRLADTLERCADHYEKEYSYTLKLRQALVYPTVLLSASGALVFFIFTFMIPRFIGLFVDMKLELPWATKLLVNSAHFIETYGTVVFFTVAPPLCVFFYVYYHWAKTRRGKASIERSLLRIPWYGTQVRYRMMAAYFRSFATLIDSGVSVFASLNLLARSVDHELLRRTAVGQIEAVRTGKQLVWGMNNQKLFPKMCMEMITVGEETGTLDQMCYRLADFFDAEMTRGLDLIGKLVEPIVLLILGAGVAVVLLAAFMPIYQLASSF